MRSALAANDTQAHLFSRASITPASKTLTFSLTGTVFTSYNTYPNRLELARIIWICRYILSESSASVCTLIKLL